MDISRKFKGCFIMANTRSSLLKCTHISTGYKCSIDFSRYVDVEKAKIISHLLSIDPRIYDLAFIIKYWLKQREVFSSNGINNYVALWLLFSYLQQLKQPILPPINEFCDKMPASEVDGVNIAFNYQLQYRTKNEEPISNLLSGFFSFYKKFDFESQIICPAIGRVMARSEFQKLNSHYFTRYSDGSEKLFDQPIDIKQRICIQDPFEKRRSVPENISAGAYHKFREAITNAAFVCRSKLSGGPIGQDCLLALFGGDATNTKRSAASTVKLDESIDADVKSNSYLPSTSSGQKRAAEYGSKMSAMPLPPKRLLAENHTAYRNGVNESSSTPTIVSVASSNGQIINSFTQIAQSAETCHSDKNVNVSKLNRQMNQDEVYVTSRMVALTRNHAEGQMGRDTKPKVTALINKPPTTPHAGAMSVPIQTNRIVVQNTFQAKSFKSIKIISEEEDFDYIKSYSEQVSGQIPDQIQAEKWARFSIHFILEILQRICRTKRRQDADKFNLPRNTPYSKKIFIDGLYDMIYQNKRTTRLATHRNAQIEITEISRANITCHIHSNQPYDAIVIDIYDCGSKNIDAFFGELKTNLRGILSTYFSKILNYVLFEPRTELLDFSNENPTVYESGVRTQQSDILKDMISFKHSATEDQLKHLEKFLQKWDSSLNLNQHGWEIHKIWSQLAIDFVLDILTKVFAFKLDVNNRPLQFADSNYSKTFDVTGIYDVFYRRAQYAIGTNRVGILSKEMKKTINALVTHGEPFERPLRAIFHIWADTTNYGTILIDIYNLREVRRYDPMNNFWNEFKIRVTPLIHVYFEKLMDDYIVLSKEFNLMALSTDVKNISPTGISQPPVDIQNTTPKPKPKSKPIFKTRG